ncbi:hypothetical protein Glove_43g2 [Diversispora epigaea]|uniref:Uncharacterized protein n=1 Tax=Diversispora epigaea TaxID=1348612 RepID=A0A397JFP0_9GLOM|nr:hypothetical protein Glove_43g2 [Diversispora epigaea]
MRIGCELNGREFVITVTSNNKNPLKPGFQCICGEFKSEIELYPSTAVKSCYQSIFNSKTEYSGLAIMGFENENIIQQLIADILFFPIFLRIENFLVVITNLGSLPKHDELTCVQKIIGETPDNVWCQLTICQKYTGSYLFGTKNALIQEKLGELENIPIICKYNDWTNIQQLEKVFAHHIKSQKIPNTIINWPHLFYNWYHQKSSIVLFPNVLRKIYPSNYIFQEKELRAWRAMFIACGCTNVTPIPKKKSRIEFWSKALDPNADKELLENLYKNNIIQLNNQTSISNSISTKDDIFWNSFRKALISNGKGSNNKIRILSIIALNFQYKDLKKELNVASDTINKARKHARLYGPGAPPLQKLKKTVQRLNDIQEDQFLLFFQDRENVTMSSYKVDSKTGLPVLYLRDQKCDLWKKFIETYPNGMKKTAFFVRLNNSTNLRYREDLGGLCQTCNDYGYETFENLTNLIYNNFENKNIMASFF